MSDSEIQRYGVLSEPAGRDLQALVELAADFFGVETAAINLITSDEQHQVATAGFEPSICSREDSMCAAVVDHPGAVVVSDASRDDRFADNPFVTGEIGSVRFYASAPLVTPGGITLGRLCVFDEQPRESTPEQQRALVVLAQRVMDVIELRLRNREVAHSVDELTRTRDELRRSNEALVHFAGQVSHDLRNPLMVISANAEMLSMEPAVADNPDLAEMVGEISDAGLRMNRLIRSVLSHARGNGAAAFDPVPLGRVFGQAVADLRTVVGSSGANVTVGDLPSVSGDPDLLYAVALNLVGNALKFTRPGTSPTVEVSAIRHDGWWRVLVRDEGIGIPDEHREDVFRPYVRLAGEESEDEVDGHGVGLATVSRIVEAHGGRVGVDSTQDVGTTVWFELPERPEDLTRPESTAR
ncbi:sensor histidine kinase [Knoellia flava]|uniref:sensor histidine kinase n=1 Tax=Knoellia flava TaxID=913969 RepID=UPI0016641965|nr:ATP-binding protein [Knoellia flava]